MRNFSQKGFTIVELVIVIAVIAILAGVLVPTFEGVVKKAKESSNLQIAKQCLNTVIAEDSSKNDFSNDTEYYMQYSDGTTTYTYSNVNGMKAVDSLGDGATAKYSADGSKGTKLADFPSGWTCYVVKKSS